MCEFDCHTMLLAIDITILLIINNKWILKSVIWCMELCQRLISPGYASHHLGRNLDCLRVVEWVTLIRFLFGMWHY